MAGPGNIFFAWISDPSSEPFDPTVHNRVDENIYSWTISQSEGEFGRAELEIDSPGAALLQTDEPWAHLSIEKADGSVKYMGTGRLTGFPIGVAAQDAVVTIELIMRPSDWESQQDSLIQGLKTAPYYLASYTPEDKRDDPEEILAARGAMLHWDPFTNSVETSDVLEGSRLIELGSDQIFHDSLELEVAGPPVSRVDVDVRVEYEQLAKDIIDMGYEVSPIYTLTPDAIRNSASSAISGDAGNYRLMYPNTGYNTVVVNSVTDHTVEVDPQEYPSGDLLIDQQALREMTFREYEMRLYAHVLCEYRQKRVETLSFSLSSETQSINNATSRKRESITLQNVDDQLTEYTGYFLEGNNPEPNGANQYLYVQDVPVRPDSSFHYDAYDPDTGTSAGLEDRGAESIKHALLRAWAKLAFAARAVEITCRVPVEDALDLTLDDSVRLVSDRIPGNAARGKLIEVSISFDGDSGDNAATVTIGCCVGTGGASYGGATSYSVGTYTNEVTTNGTSAESRVSGSASPDGSIPVPSLGEIIHVTSASQKINSVSVTNGASAQMTGVENALSNGNDPDAWLQANPTKIDVDFLDISPAVESQLKQAITVSTDPVGLPAHINLGNL